MSIKGYHNSVDIISSFNQRRLSRNIGKWLKNLNCSSCGMDTVWQLEIEEAALVDIGRNKLWLKRTIPRYCCLCDKVML